MMFSASDEDLFCLLDRLRACTLPRGKWTHAAHLAAAVCLLSECTLEEAERVMPPLIRAYNEATGTPNTETEGYHHTITLASLRAVDHVRRDAAGAGVAEVLRVLLGSRYAAAGWMSAHWSRDRLFCVAARRRWVEPDLLRLPF